MEPCLHPFSLGRGLGKGGNRKSLHAIDLMQIWPSHFNILLSAFKLASLTSFKVKYSFDF